MLSTAMQSEGRIMYDMEFYNLVLKFEMELSHYWYDEIKNQLLNMEHWAFENSTLIEKSHKINVKDVYKQLYAFERHIDSSIPSTITQTREEGIIFAMISYAKQNKPIVESIFTERTKIFKIKQTNYNPETERIKETLRKKVFYQSDLLAFYMDNCKNEECYAALHYLFSQYMENLILLNKYEDYNEFDIEKLEKLPNRYDNGFILHYLKLLVKHKDFEIAKKIYGQYTITPCNKKETTDYDKIKAKLEMN